MNKIFKLCLFLIVLVTSGCEFKLMQVSSMAKEYCSCVFVSKQSNDYCLDMSSHLLHKIRFQSLDVKVDNEIKTVTASLGDQKSTYQFKSERLGCAIAD